jgi:hypothetical protein
LSRIWLEEGLLDELWVWLLLLLLLLERSSSMNDLLLFRLLLELKLLEKVRLAVGGGREGEEIRWVESSEWGRPGGTVLLVGGVSVGGCGWQTRKKSLHRSQWT